MVLSTEYLRTIMNPDLHSVADWITASFKEDKRIMIERDFDIAFQYVKDNWSLFNSSGWARYIGMPRATLSCAILDIKGSRGIEKIHIPPFHKEAFIVLAKQFGLNAPKGVVSAKVTDETFSLATDYIQARKHLLHMNEISRRTDIPPSSVRRQFNPNDNFKFPEKYKESLIKLAIEIGCPINTEDYETE